MVWRSTLLRVHGGDQDSATPARLNSADLGQ